MLKPKVLFILPNYNIYGGTPKKTLDLMRFFKEDSVLYIYDNTNADFKKIFLNTDGKVYEGLFGYNMIKHLQKLLEIIDKERINVIHTQFAMGEAIGLLLKIFRPKIKLVVAFVGPFNPSGIKRILSNLSYYFADYFIYITEYVKETKTSFFSILKKRKGKVIYNGTRKRVNNNADVIYFNKPAILDVAGLVDWKNIQIVIKAIHIVINKRKKKEIFLYVAGDGKYRSELERLIREYSLEEHVFLIGYQSDIGQLLEMSDIFVHPAYAEGFGIAVAEAMHAEKPVIVSNAGALPELIEHEVSGLIVDPHDAEEWAHSIMRVLNNQDFSNKLASGAKKRAEEMFSVEQFCRNYYQLYKELLNN